MKIFKWVPSSNLIKQNKDHLNRRKLFDDDCANGNLGMDEDSNMSAASTASDSQVTFFSSLIFNFKYWGAKMYLSILFILSWGSYIYDSCIKILESFILLFLRMEVSNNKIWIILSLKIQKKMVSLISRFYIHVN